MTLTELRAKKAEEIKQFLALLEDESGLEKMMSQEKELLNQLATLRARIDQFRSVLGLGPRAQAEGELFSNGEMKQTRKRIAPEEIQNKVLLILENSAGVSVKELSEKISIPYHVILNWKKKSPFYAERVEERKEGTSVIITLKEAKKKK